MFGVPLVHVVDGCLPCPSDKPLRPLSGADPHLVEPTHHKSFELTAFHVAARRVPTEQSASFRNTTVGVSTTINSFGSYRVQSLKVIVST